MGLGQKVEHNPDGTTTVTDTDTDGKVTKYHTQPHADGTETRTITDPDGTTESSQGVGRHEQWPEGPRGLLETSPASVERSCVGE